MAETRSRVRKVIYAFGAVLVAVMLLRFFLRLVGAPGSNVIINFIYQVSFPLVQPFEGIVDNISNSGSSFEGTTLVAMMIWIALLLIFAEVVTAFLYDTFAEIFLNFIDAVFKFIEFFLVARLAMRMFGVRLGVNSFVDIIYSLAGVVYEPFAGIAPEIELNTGVIELSTLIALIIVIVADIVSEGFLRSLLDLPEADQQQKSDTVVINNPGTTSLQPQIIRGQQPTQPQQVNVYLPPQPQQPVVVHNPPGPVRTEAREVRSEI